MLQYCNQALQVDCRNDVEYPKDHYRKSAATSEAASAARSLTSKSQTRRREQGDKEKQGDMGPPPFIYGVLTAKWSSKRKKQTTFVVPLLFMCLLVIVWASESSFTTLITNTVRRYSWYDTEEHALDSTSVDMHIHLSLEMPNDTDLHISKTTAAGPRKVEQRPLVLDHSMTSPRFNVTAVIEIHKHRLYIFSAILRNISKTAKKDSTRYDLVLTGWIHKEEQSPNFSCCVRMQNDEIILASVYKTIKRNLHARLVAAEFLCAVTNSVSVHSVSMTTNGSTCPRNSEFYLKMYDPGPPRPGLAVCSKIGYRSLDAKYLVEWFEIVRLLGASKVISYTYELNKDAMKVLRYYEDIGYADIYAFDYPDKVTVPRQIGEKNHQSFSDETVTVYDCTERLANYQYVTIMDKDEIIVPDTDRLRGALLRFLGAQLQDEPKLGSMTFKTQIHNITGDPLSGNTMYTDHYHLCSRALIDRQKNIYLPSRVIPGTVSTHWLSVAKGYKSQTVSEDKATIHHYRKPRRDYNGGIRKLEYNISCSVMRRLSDMVRKTTTTIRIKLGLV